MIKLTDRQTLNSFPARIFQLERGLTVIHQYIPVTPVVVVDVWVKAGTINEPEEWSGMAHFLEHMIFKGTKHIAPGVFDWVIENSGGATNAATSHDYAHFFLTTTAQKLETTLPYLAEILLQAEIPEQEFYRERDVVLEELRSCYDDPDWIAYQTLCESLYQNHPYGRAILGNENRILQLSPQQMRCFHRTYYQPENLIIVIVGGIEEKDALAAVERAFEGFSARSECPPSTIEAEPPLIDIRRSQLYLPRLEQARLAMGWIGPGIEQLEDAFGLDLLSVVLASGRSSRLVRQLREEQQLVLDIESSFSLQRDSSLFTINAWLSPENIPAVEESLCEHLWNLHKTPITPEELTRCQRSLCNDYIFSTETPGQLAGLYGYYQTIASADLSVIYSSAIKQFQALDVQRLASQYLSPERYAVTIMQPC